MYVSKWICTYIDPLYTHMTHMNLMTTQQPPRLRAQCAHFSCLAPLALHLQPARHSVPPDVSLPLFTVGNQTTFDGTN